MKKQNILRRLVDEDSSRRMYLLLWILLASIIIGLIWQAAEIVLYGAVQERSVDNIIAIAYAVAMVMIYYLGCDDEKEAIMRPDCVDSRINFQYDIATQRLLLHVSLRFYNHSIVTTTIPLGKNEAELLKNYVSAYIELTDKLEEEESKLQAGG